MIFKDYYKILGLETNKVTKEEIKTAYKEQVKRYHPDVKNGSEERFKDISEAYKVLLESSSKRKYDRMWMRYVGSKQNKEKFEESKREKGSAFSDFFKLFFGDNVNEPKKTDNKSNGKVAIKGENIETEINISIEEAYYGVEKKISLRTIDGKMKTFSIKVPAGIRNGEKVRLLGQGKVGTNGAKNGDLLIKINIQNNSKFTLEGYELITDLCLAPWEAALGTRVNIAGIEDNISLYIPAGIESGETVRIPKKGYKDGKGSRGDLIVNIRILVPKHISDEEKELYEKLSEISKFNPRAK